MERLTLSTVDGPSIATRVLERLLSVAAGSGYWRENGPQCKRPCPRTAPWPQSPAQPHAA